jgi:sugar/nucleoside kinase (ribokinase family)
MSLLVIGTMAFDAIETPFAKVDSIIGGAATFITLSASFFVQPVNLVAVIGYDYPQETVDDLVRRGVNIEGLQRKTDQKSFFWAGKYYNDLNTRDTVATELNVLADFDPIIPKSYQGTPFVLLGNLTPSVQMQVIERMKDRPQLIAMDTMNFWMDIALDSLLETIKKVDLLTINDEEARQLTGEFSLIKAGKKILTMGPKYAVIKKGEHGALLFYEDQVFVAPALPLEEVFDPTGAGDSFAGGMMGYLARQGEVTFDNLKNAIIYGSTLASFCVEDFGPRRLLTLTKDEIRQRYLAFQQISAYNQTLI